MLRPGDLTDIAQQAASIREVMQSECLVEKTQSGLSSALSTVREVRRQIEQDGRATLETLVPTLSVRNMAQACELVLSACMNRRETRSAHYRLDHPRTETSLAHSFRVRRGSDGQPTFERFDY